MKGPYILARTMSMPTRRGNSERAWQYHSRSDAHSKIACWTVLFDLLMECDVVRRDAEAGRLGFGINHQMVGPINKTLDLVLTRVSSNRPKGRRRNFKDLAEDYNVILEPEEREALNSLPLPMEESKEDMSEVVIALEAKACMTEHIKSIPRLHAEILATGYLAKQAVPRCIAVSYSLVNTAPTFVTPSGKGKPNVHSQPSDARRVIDMLSTAVPLARNFNNLLGYDVVGVTAIACRNDGSPVTIEQDDPAPKPTDHVRYERMIALICSEYRSRFAG